MNLIVDTQILIFEAKRSKKKYDLTDSNICSISALEFLKIQEKKSNSAKYYPPLLDPLSIHDMGLIKNRDHPYPKGLTDSIKFDFNQEFDSFTSFSNLAISNIINEKYTELFNSSIKFHSKEEYKDIKKKFNYLLKNNIKCSNIGPKDIVLAYELLNKFLETYSVKEDFRNSWNDILILSKAINSSSELFTQDKLLNKFASEIYNGEITKKDDFISIKFPSNIDEKPKFNKESKGYINRSWSYIIRKGNS
jgi:hypothetical protein